MLRVFPHCIQFKPAVDWKLFFLLKNPGNGMFCLNVQFDRYNSRIYSHTLTLPVDYWEKKEETCGGRVSIQSKKKQLGEMAEGGRQNLSLTRELIARNKDSLDTLLCDNCHTNDTSGRTITGHCKGESCRGGRTKLSVVIHKNNKHSFQTKDLNSQFLTNWMHSSWLMPSRNVASQ